MATPSGMIDDNGISMRAQLPTGAKLFLILSAALLPLAAIALFATLQTNRNADQIAYAHLQSATGESAHALTGELLGDMTALRVTLDALDVDVRNAPSCARAQGVFTQQIAAGARFAIRTASGHLVCGTTFPGMNAVAKPPRDLSVTARIMEGRGLVLAMAGAHGRTTATAFFPSSFLATIARPVDVGMPHGVAIRSGAAELTLASLGSAGPLGGVQHAHAPIQIAGLSLDMTIASAPITSPLLVAMLLPILMWAAAAGIAWFVVDRLLIRPLRQLRAGVAAYVPGQEIDIATARTAPAQEIRDLSETFRIISRTVALHEAGLAEGLVRQTKLTREVHHRVKNNLQVISSLINFHMRSAETREATTAYSSIQRRVDALAVVHRYHFAELEENRGLSLRAVIGELASNIRATAPEDSAALGITIDVAPFLVSQDVAVAVAFLITEIIELAMTCNGQSQVRVSVRPNDVPQQAVLRISSPALIECERLRQGIQQRYGRVMEGLARQLRSRLVHEPLTGAFEIAIAVTGRD